VKQTKYKRTTYEETLLGDSLTPVEAKVIISKYDGEMEEIAVRLHIRNNHYSVPLPDLEALAELAEFLIDVVEIETKKMIKRGDL